MTRRLAVAAVLLVALTFAVYWPVHGFAFVELDDPYYVYANDSLATLHGTAALHYAFTTFTGGNYHPLVWLTFLFDRWAWHLSAGPMHVENVALHAASAVLVMLLLVDATSAFGRSALCAAVFAIHPMHVESVAWISERKDVLSTVWLLAAACAYVRFARTSWRCWYAAMIACYLLSLSAKSMGVTLPFVLLLLDGWPLGRLRGHVSQRVVEKLPLLAIAAAASVVAMVAQRAVGAMSVITTTAADRIGNAAVSYCAQLGGLFWPSRMAVFYPFHPVPTIAAFVSILLLLAITAAAIRVRGRRPYLLVGWLWFAGTLLPVSGIVQVGMAAMADRYTYFPSIGLSVAIVWLIADLFARIRWAGPVLATATIGALGVICARQVSYWRDNQSLFAHAVDVTDNNYLALDELGREAIQRGDLPTAVRRLTDSIQANPDYDNAYADLGRCALIAGHPTEAVEAYGNAVRLAPNVASYRRGLATATELQAHGEPRLHSTP